jgi:adenylate kinase family enzyme
VQRISVVGNSGSGKTTVGKALAARLGVPFVELDSINHQPNWQPLPKAEFQARVAEIVAGDGWVIDGNYRAVQPQVWARADTVVWFDLPRSKVMRQVILRTLRRGLLRQELWNGNRERLANFIKTDPEESVIRWAWTRHAGYHDHYQAAATDPAWHHLDFIRIGSRADARALMAAP